MRQLLFNQVQFEILLDTHYVQYLFLILMLPWFVSFVQFHQIQELLLLLYTHEIQEDLQHLFLLMSEFLQIRHLDNVIQ